MNAAAPIPNAMAIAAAVSQGLLADNPIPVTAKIEPNSIGFADALLSSKVSIFVFLC